MRKSTQSCVHGFMIGLLALGGFGLTASPKAEAASDSKVVSVRIMIPPRPWERVPESGSIERSQEPNLTGFEARLAPERDTYQLGDKTITRYTRLIW